MMDESKLTMIQYVWRRMTGRYGYKWTSCYGERVDSATALEWQRELEQFNRDDIDDAIAACATTGDPWPPSLPEFKSYCYGIPTLNSVKVDLTTRKLGFTRLVWKYLDASAMGRVDQNRADALVKSAYDYAREKRMYGEPLPMPDVMVRDPKPVKQPNDPEHVRKTQEAIAQTLREWNERS